MSIQIQTLRPSIRTIAADGVDVIAAEIHRLLARAVR